MQNTIAAIALATVAGSAVAQLQITEVYTGIDQQDGTEDWFELTNFGPSDVSTAGLFYDDAPADIAKLAALSDLTVGAGESVIFLLTDDLSAGLAEFQAVWGNQFDASNVGFVDGSGLGQSGDGVNIFSSNTDLNDLIDSFSYDASGTLQTFDVFSQAGGLSVLGEGGAYASNPFFNDAAGDDIQLIGSPGAIPAPAAVALAGVAGLAATRRRRA